MLESPVFQLLAADVVASGKSLLSGINLTVNIGDSLVLVGPSGGGKSSLLKLLLGGFHIDAGELHFMGELVNATTLSNVRKSVAYIPQHAPSGGELVNDYLSCLFSWNALQDSQFSLNDVESWFEKLDLNMGLMSSVLNQLSGGQRQRLSIVRGLMTGRKILVADEPTSALDDDSCCRVVSLLLGSGFTVVSASHDPRWIQSCQRSLLVKDGSVSNVAEPLSEVAPL